MLFGYDPSNWKYLDRDSILFKAADILLSLICPEISIRNKYSQFLSFVGMDSIFVIDILPRDNICKLFDNSPDLFCIDITKEVLSFLDSSTLVLPM